MCWGPAHQRVIGEAWIGGGIADVERLARPYDLIAKRAPARRLTHPEADARLEPDAILIDERHAQDGHLQRGLRKTGDAIEGGRGRRIQKSEPMQGNQALRLVHGHASILQCSISRLERSSHAGQVKDPAPLG